MSSVSFPQVSQCKGTRMLSSHDVMMPYQRRKDGESKKMITLSHPRYYSKRLVRGPGKLYSNISKLALYNRPRMSIHFKGISE